MPEIPPTSIIRDIRPDHPDSDVLLTYSSLLPAADGHRQWDVARANQVWAAEPDSLEEMDAAREWAMANLVRTAGWLVCAPNPQAHDLGAERFTRSSIELYGEPDAHEAVQLMRQQQRWLHSLQERTDVDQQGVSFLLDFYKPIVGEITGPIDVKDAETESNQYMLKEIAEVIYEQYQPLLDLVTAVQADMISARDLKAIFQASCAWLAEQREPTWADWNVVEVNDAISSVNADKKEVSVGMLSPLLTKQAAQELLVHELLVHALRSVNARVLESDLLCRGLPDYSVFEEGFATLTGQAFGGKRLPNPREHYMNVALALGSVDGRPQSRSTLLKVSLAIEKLRRQDTGTYDSADSSIEGAAYIRINRIFRGGLGDDFAGAKNQAVFTKDIAYHKGYRAAEDYIRQARASGVSMRAIYDYLLLGSFDPTQAAHEAFVLRTTGISRPTAV